MGDILRRASNTLNEESLPKQWLRRIGYLRPLSASIIRVVEVGVEKCCRSITWDIDTYGSFFNSGCVTACCYV